MVAFSRQVGKHRVQIGLVVERVSGMKLADFFRSRIFAPLKMDDTFFTVPVDKLDRLTDCYTFVPGKGRIMYDRGAESAWTAGFPFSC